MTYFLFQVFSWGHSLLFALLNVDMERWRHRVLAFPSLLCDFSLDLKLADSLVIREVHLISFREGLY